ncbi:aldo/keto reductase [Glycomyces arizonensis]|uniref:aldo/keto reductase n=1 Tax=Glycomyces arizonensis TaxID=256035 RepID=UPI000552E7C2|nr:aldo/keto reductase [Glycomyces arizonensis]
MNAYHLLGGSGLRVSPLALGTMTFAQDDWGSDEAAARAILDRYLEAGGNFVDTADMYAQGRSEAMLGKFLADPALRDQVVLATKYSHGGGSRNPNRVGNGRKNMLATLEDSLRRLGTDYIDLYWVHIWDTVTPVEEIMSTFDALVRSGKVRAVGLSNVPAWYAAKAQMTARWRGWEPVAALQLEYSLADREVEVEHTAAALDLSMGLVSYSPLAAGFLTGRYRRDGNHVDGEGRLNGASQRYFREMLGGFDDRHWRLLDVLGGIAEEVGRSMAQVALNWAVRRRAVASVIIGARDTAQLEQNLAAVEFELTAEQVARLDEASAPVPNKLLMLQSPEVHQRFMSGGHTVTKEPAWYRG